MLADNDGSCGAPIRCELFAHVAINADETLIVDARTISIYKSGFSDWFAKPLWWDVWPARQHHRGSTEPAEHFLRTTSPPAQYDRR